MRVIIPDPIKPRRGLPVLEGAVYYKKNGKPFFRVVLAVIKTERSRPFNNVVCLHVAATGEIMGCSNQPEGYVRNHMDLIGHVESMPELKLIFNEQESP